MWSTAMRSDSTDSILYGTGANWSVGLSPTTRISDS